MTSKVQDVFLSFFVLICLFILVRWFVCASGSLIGGFIPCIPQKMCLDDKLQLSKLAQKVRQVPAVDGTKTAGGRLWLPAGHKRFAIRCMSLGYKQNQTNTQTSQTCSANFYMSRMSRTWDPCFGFSTCFNWFRGCAEHVLSVAVRPGIEPLEMRSLEFTSTEWSWFTSRGQMPMTC